MAWLAEELAGDADEADAVIEQGHRQMRPNAFAIFPFVELHQPRKEGERIRGEDHRIADVDARREAEIPFAGRQLVHLGPVALHHPALVHDKGAEGLAEFLRRAFAGRVRRKIAGRPLQEQALAAQLLLDVPAQEAG